MDKKQLIVKPPNVNDGDRNRGSGLNLNLKSTQRVSVEQINGTPDNAANLLHHVTSAEQRSIADNGSTYREEKLGTGEKLQSARNQDQQDMDEQALNVNIMQTNRYNEYIEEFKPIVKLPMTNIKTKK